MQILFFLLSFIIGAFIASFLGVIITRLRDLSRSNLQSVLIGRSACDHCNQTLTRRQLIPLLGYCFQRGKCYSCKTKIPSWMSWFELILGIVFALLYLQFGRGGELRYIWGVSALLLGLLVADLLYMEINIIFLILLILLIFAYHVSLGILSFTRLRSLSLLLGFLVIYAGGRYIAKLKFGMWQEGFGFGDVLVSIPIGLLLGQLLGNLERFDRIRRINIYILTASLSMLVYILIIQKFQKSPEHYFPFLVGMVASLLILSLRRIY